MGLEMGWLVILRIAALIPVKALGVRSFLTRECAHAHERVIAIVGFSLGRSVRWLVRLLTFGHAQ